MNNYEVKGNLFSADLLENLSTKTGQKEADFGLNSAQRLSDEISCLFSTYRNLWESYQQKIQHLSEAQSGVSETRKLWMLPFFSFLGYELQFEQQEELDDASFNLSHREITKDGFPVHIAGFRQPLDQGKGAGKMNRYAPHVQMQEYLNRTEHLYGIITNGYRVRLLRDHHRLTGIQYLEWDLEQMMEENDLASFSILYRMLHISRIPDKQGADSLLENYHQSSVEDGHRVREELKSAVRDSLLIFGNSFLRHAKNERLRQQIQTNKLSAVEYGQLLRRLVYRLLFLLVAEDRQSLFEDNISISQKELYRHYYSLNRFREMAKKHHLINPRHTDLWEQLKTTFSFFEGNSGRLLGLSMMGGDLFSKNGLSALTDSKLSNRDFLKAMDLLSYFNPRGGQRVRINYGRINVEEFGAVYESLLDSNPDIDLCRSKHTLFNFSGQSRKLTGAYYTHPDLVKQLISSTIDPLLKEQRKEVEAQRLTGEEQKDQLEKKLLQLKVCDPACGSGHFLLGAARTLGTELAYIRAKEGESIDQYERQALRDVIEQCIYGVDINPDAVELCRLVLWLEAYVPGKPITYLDHKIKCGNSLVGWLGQEEKEVLIPQGAFKTIQGDNQKIASRYKQKNIDEQKGVRELDFSKEDKNIKQLIAQYYWSERPINSQEDLWQKQRSHRAYEESAATQQLRRLYNAWTYAFFQAYDSESEQVLTQAFLEQLKAGAIDSNHPLVRTVDQRAKGLGFFHWNLEFPEVFGRSIEQKGFDVLLGNPPWENITMQKEEFFAERSKEIADATNASNRKKLIDKLGVENYLFKEYLLAKKLIECQVKFLQAAGNFSLSNYGKLNTYSLFAELSIRLVSQKGRVGIIVPTGIATDYGNRHFFSHIIENKRLVSLYDFENRAFKGRASLFPDVHNSFKSSLITLSGSNLEENHKAEFAFFLHQVSQLNQKERILHLSLDDFRRINPNTLNSPVLRSNVDAQIIKKIGENFPILFKEESNENPWQIESLIMLNFSNCSKHLRNQKELKGKSLSKDWLRIYEAKFFWHYNHRLSSFLNAEKRKDGAEYLENSELHKSNLSVKPWYWIKSEKVPNRQKTSQKWFFGYRKITGSTNERTLVCSILPDAAFVDSSPLIVSSYDVLNQCALFASFSSLVLDYICKQKLGGNNLTVFLLKQLPIIPPEQFTAKDLQFIVPRVIELTYTAWDLKAFADDVWEEADETLRELIEARWQYNQQLIAYTPSTKPKWVESKKGEFPFTPFKWDSENRMTIQAELDAYFAFKYQLGEEELKYVLDPELSALAGKDFPGETFRVLKEKEIKKYGEYRTARLVLRAWLARAWENPTAKRELAKRSKSRKRRFRKPDQMHIVMARIIKLHQDKPKYSNNLGRTKMEKLLHGIEAVTDLDLGRRPVKDEYGPADFEFLTQAERNAEELDYFKTIKVNVGKHKKDKDYRFEYRMSANFEQLTKQFESSFSKEQQQKIDRLIELFLSFRSTQTELRITTYAAWNNLLLQKVNIQEDQQIVSAARVDWHVSKLRHQPEEFHEALDWLRANQVIPEGKGKLVEEMKK